MDIHYSDRKQVRAKLKAKVIKISLKAFDDFAKAAELFDTIQKISSKIKVAQGASMFEVDVEYIALVARHLIQEAKIDWVKSELSGWTNFYSLLRKRVRLAKTLLTDESIVKALLGIQSKDKEQCSTYIKFHERKMQKSSNCECKCPVRILLIRPTLI